MIGNRNEMRCGEDRADPFALRHRAIVVEAPRGREFPLIWRIGGDFSGKYRLWVSPRTCAVVLSSDGKMQFFPLGGKVRLYPYDMVFGICTAFEEYAASYAGECAVVHPNLGCRVFSYRLRMNQYRTFFSQFYPYAMSGEPYVYDVKFRPRGSMRPCLYGFVHARVTEICRGLLLEWCTSDPCGDMGVYVGKTFEYDLSDSGLSVEIAYCASRFKEGEAVEGMKGKDEDDGGEA